MVAVLFAAVWIPCCVSDVVLPWLVSRGMSSSTDGPVIDAPPNPKPSTNG